MIPLVGAVLLAMLLVMATGWVVQQALANAGWVDVFWTFGSGGVLAAAALFPLTPHAAPTARQLLVAGLVAAWSLRLGAYIAARVASGPEDVRYVGFRQDWGPRFQSRLLGLMLVQAPATAILSVSVLLAARKPAPDLGLADGLGLLILIAAVMGEGLADAQMQRFKADPAHRGQVCDTGLWAWSRHPNYLFEFLGWLAYPTIAFRASDPSSLFALAAPAVMFVILRFGTGVPPLEAAMVRSKGEAYRRYQARVSPFLPRPPKETAA